MPSVSDPGVYLGLPAIWGRSKRSSLAFVKGRVLGKIQGWKQSALSFAGKEVLLKVVVQAIPIYPMNLFKFPVAVCKDLDSMSAGFLWGDCGGHRRIHWVNWDTLGRPKYEGGLGFQNFQDFNDALLVKQCWRLILNPNSLWAQTLKACYFPHSSFLDAKLGSRASWAWASLLVGRDILKNGAHWQILNGRDTRIWVDRWLPSLPLGHPIPNSPTSVTLNTKVPLSRSRPSPILDPRWSPPSVPFIKVNVDASWCQMDGMARLAAVLRDHNGLFVAARKWSIGAPSVVFAEALAMLKGCELAAELGFRWIVAELDSLEVVSSLKGDIAQGSWESADHLASRSNLKMCGITWVRRPPSSLVHILNKDGLPCPP
ncbi:hypothetical protein ACFX12_032647 [Malus domestica]